MDQNTFTASYDSSVTELYSKYLWNANAQSRILINLLKVLKLPWQWNYEDSQSMDIK